MSRAYYTNTGLAAQAGVVADDRNAQGKGPQSTKTLLTNCPGGPANTTTFKLTPAGQLQVNAAQRPQPSNLQTRGCQAESVCLAGHLVWVLAVFQRTAAARCGTETPPPPPPPPPPHTRVHTHTHTHTRARQVGDGTLCLTSGDIPGVQMWVKPLLDDKVAVLVLNPLMIAQKQGIPLADIPGLAAACASAPSSCSVRSVWDATNVKLDGSVLAVDLAAHETAVCVLCCGVRWMHSSFLVC